MKKLIKILVLTSALLITIPGYSQRVGLGLSVQIGPPQPLQEIIIERPYPEAVWVPGYYVYDPGIANYVWVTGRWQRPPYYGARWIAPEWRHERGGYRFRHGRWK